MHFKRLQCEPALHVDFDCVRPVVVVRSAVIVVVADTVAVHLRARFGGRVVEMLVAVFDVVESGLGVALAAVEVVIGMVFAGGRSADSLAEEEAGENDEDKHLGDCQQIAVIWMKK